MATRMDRCKDNFAVSRNPFLAILQREAISGHSGETKISIPVQLPRKATRRRLEMPQGPDVT